MGGRGVDVYCFVYCMLYVRIDFLLRMWGCGKRWDSLRMWGRGGGCGMQDVGRGVFVWPSF